jgi:hypothetical protein
MFDRHELLRLISEAEMPDRTDVEETSALQEAISRQRMNDWLLDRGEYRSSGEVPATPS